MNMFLESVFASTLVRSLILIKESDVARRARWNSHSATRPDSRVKSHIMYYIISACATYYTRPSSWALGSLQELTRAWLNRKRKSYEYQFKR